MRARHLLMRLELLLARLGLHKIKALDVLIDTLFADAAAVVVVQIGANDGKSGWDPLYSVIRHDARFSGVLVEPVPFLYDRLRENYGNEPRFAYENVAIGNDDSTLPFFYVDDSIFDAFPTLNRMATRISSFDRAHVAKHFHDDTLVDTAHAADYVTFIRQMDVPVVSLNTLLSRHNIATLDVLVVDAEGYDLQIVGQLDVTRFRPRLIVFEDTHTDSDAYRALKARLEAHDYTMIAVFNNMLALRNNG